MSDERELCRWGGSIGVWLPNRIFQQMHFHEGEQVRVVIDDADTVRLERVSKNPDTESSL